MALNDDSIDSIKFHESVPPAMAEPISGGTAFSDTGIKLYSDGTVGVMIPEGVDRQSMLATYEEMLGGGSVKINGDRIIVDPNKVQSPHFSEWLEGERGTRNPTRVTLQEVDIGEAGHPKNDSGIKTAMAEPISGGTAFSDTGIKLYSDGTVGVMIPEGVDRQSMLATYEEMLGGGSVKINGDRIIVDPNKVQSPHFSEWLEGERGTRNPTRVTLQEVDIGEAGHRGNPDVTDTAPEVAPSRQWIPDKKPQEQDMGDHGSLLERDSAATPGGSPAPNQFAGPGAPSDGQPALAEKQPMNHPSVYQDTFNALETIALQMALRKAGYDLGTSGSKKHGDIPAGEGVDGVFHDSKNPGLSRTAKAFEDACERAGVDPKGVSLKGRPNEATQRLMGYLKEEMGKSPHEQAARKDRAAATDAPERDETAADKRVADAGGDRSLNDPGEGGFIPSSTPRMASINGRGIA